jgi:hypothetical protein
MLQEPAQRQDIHAYMHGHSPNTGRQHGGSNSVPMHLKSSAEAMNKATGAHNRRTPDLGDHTPNRISVYKNDDNTRQNEFSRGKNRNRFSDHAHDYSAETARYIRGVLNESNDGHSSAMMLDIAVDVEKTLRMEIQQVCMHIYMCVCVCVYGYVCIYRHRCTCMHAYRHTCMH